MNGSDPGVLLAAGVVTAWVTALHPVNASDVNDDESSPVLFPPPTFHTPHPGSSRGAARDQAHGCTQGYEAHGYTQQVMERRKVLS